MDPPPTHLFYSAQNYAAYSHPQPSAAQNYVYSYPPPSTLDPAQNYLCTSAADPAQNYVYTHPPPSAADPAQYYVYSHPPPSAADPARNYDYSHPTPSAADPALNYVYSHPTPSAAAAAPAPEFCTPMSPYRSQNPTPYSLPQPPTPSTAIPYPPYTANSAVYNPHSFSSNVGFRQNARYPILQSHAIIDNNPPIPHPNHNDDYLRRIRNEVILLHALWEQGPPGSNSNSNFIDDPVGNHHLKPSPTTVFKKKKKTTRSIPVSDNPWPVPTEPSAPPNSESGWPELPSRPTPPAPISSEEDKARVSVAKVQRKASDSFRSFFGGKHGPESESESDDDDDAEDQDDVCAKFDKFWEVFEGDQELRDYYVKNWGNGEFLCLVCGGSGQNVGRKYKNSLALVQHTVTVSNTKKKKAHRAYGQVLCKVLGWNINRLPLVSRNLCLQQGNGMSSAEACKDDLVVVETSIAPLVSGNEQSDPSKATCYSGDDISAEKKETSDLSMILDNPGDHQGNDLSSAEACKDDHVVVGTTTATLVSGNEQSDSSKDTCDLGDSAEKKETFDLSLILDNPVGQQINIASSGGTSKNHPDISEENTDVILNELSDRKTADDNAAEKHGTSSLPCVVMGSEGGITDTYGSVHGPATQI